MAALVRQIELGDITFGAPEGISLLHSPWGYYKILGVDRSASAKDITAAYVRLSTEFHPDREGGDLAKFKAIEHAFRVLTDNPGELGLEHSRRRHYDEVCKVDEYFGGHIIHKGDRTKKYSEIVLIQLEGQRMYAQAVQDFETRFPEAKELRERFKRARSDESRQRINDEFQDLVLKAKGVSPEMRDELEKRMKEDETRYEKSQQDILNRFSRNPEKYFPKVLDVYYRGGGKVEFGTNQSRMSLAISMVIDREHFIEMIVENENAYIGGFGKVHFKSEHADVKISDPNLEGIVQVKKGAVRVELPESSYGGVIRARAPRLFNISGFVQDGELFVPERFATGGWKRKKPVLDIAVMDGSVSFALQSTRISPKRYSRLDSLLEGGYYKDLNQIISNDSFYNNKNIYKKF